MGAKINCCILRFKLNETNFTFRVFVLAEKETVNNLGKVLSNNGRIKIIFWNRVNEKGRSVLSHSRILKKV